MVALEPFTVDEQRPRFEGYLSIPGIQALERYEEVELSRY